MEKVGSDTGLKSVAIAVWVWSIARAIGIGIDVSPIHAEEPKPSVRPATAAGVFYPANPESLTKNIKDLLSKPQLDTPLAAAKAIIVPHASYYYSGVVAAHSYLALKKDFKKAFLISSNHVPSAPDFKFSISNFDFYQTPLGKVKIAPTAQELLKHPSFKFIPRADASHIIEVQLPFLQNLSSNFEIVPIITGNVTASDLEQLAELIVPLIDDDTVLVISSDLSHYHRYEKAAKLDKKCATALANLAVDDLLACETCSLPALYLLLQIAKTKQWQGKLLAYQNSGDTGGGKLKVVGYSAIAYYEAEALKLPPLSDQELGAVLLKLARLALEADLIGTGLPATDFVDLPEELKERAACFVTLKSKGDLRGCIGSFIDTTPLYLCVIEKISSASKQDYRFLPLRPEEVKEVKIEIDIISEIEAVSAKGRKDFLEELMPGQNGVLVRRGEKEATFLPDIWQLFPEKERFLAELCKRAQLSNLCWSDEKVELFKFRTRSFKESENDDPNSTTLHITKSH